MERSCLKGCFCSKEGFTLIELLVVVLIIGILAAVAVPQYQKAVLKSHLVQLQIWADTLYKSAVVYHLANGVYPTDVRELDLDISAKNSYYGMTDLGSAEHTGIIFMDGNKKVSCAIFSINVGNIWCADLDFVVHINSNSGTMHCRSRGTVVANEVCRSMSVNDTFLDDGKAYPLWITRRGNY